MNKCFLNVLHIFRAAFSKMPLFKMCDCGTAVALRSFLVLGNFHGINGADFSRIIREFIMNATERYSLS